MKIDLVNKTVSADEYVTEAYKEFGSYSNLHRHIPYVLDGLKPVYKKVLVTLLLKEPPGKMIKTANVTGLTIGYYSPHGDASMKDVVATLVRAGILEGQGNHGIKMLSGESASCAAPRYTECRLAASVRAQIDKLIDYVPTFVNDLGNEEPEYIPTPLSFSLTMGNLGIGIGTGCKTPSFSADSLIKAYRADDPGLLKPGYKMLFKNEPDQLKKIWMTGQGRLTYMFETVDVPGGIEVIGNPELYQPNFTYLYQERGWGNVVIEDRSSDISRLRFLKAPRVQKMTQEFLRDEVRKQCTFRDSFYVRAHYNGCVYPLGIRDWIDITYNNYAKLIERYKNDNITKSENAIKVYNNFRAVADKLINTEDSRETIAQSLNIEPWIVDEIGKKSINTLRKLDPDKEIKKQEENIKFYKKVKADAMIDEYVKDSFQEY